MKKQFIVELENNVWLAGWPGDPGRTTVIENAKQFKTRVLAENALLDSRQFRAFRNGKITTR